MTFCNQRLQKVKRSYFSASSPLHASTPQGPIAAVPVTSGMSGQPCPVTLHSARYRVHALARRCLPKRCEKMLASGSLFGFRCVNAHSFLQFKKSQQCSTRTQILHLINSENPATSALSCPELPPALGDGAAGATSGLCSHKLLLPLLRGRHHWGLGFSSSKLLRRRRPVAQCLSKAMEELSLPRERLLCNLDSTC